MNEKTYMDADYEVISMVNRRHGPGGELPGHAVAFIPKDRVDRAEALDYRLRVLEYYAPAVAVGCGSLLVIVLAAVEWIHPILAAATVAGSLVRFIFARKAGNKNVQRNSDTR